MSIVGYPTIKDHNASLGASSSLPLPRLSSQSERVGWGFRSADSMAISAFQEYSRSAKRELTQTSCLFINMMQKLFLKMNIGEITHALKCIELFRHGRTNSDSKHQK